MLVSWRVSDQIVSRKTGVYITSNPRCTKKTNQMAPGGSKALEILGSLHLKKVVFSLHPGLAHSP